MLWLLQALQDEAERSARPVVQRKYISLYVVVQSQEVSTHVEVDSMHILAFARPLINSESKLIRPLAGQLFALAMVAINQNGGIPPSHTVASQEKPVVRLMLTDLIQRASHEASLIVDKESEDTPMLETLLYALMTAAQRHARVLAPYTHMVVGPVLQLLSQCSKEATLLMLKATATLFASMSYPLEACPVMITACMAAYDHPEWRVRISVIRCLKALAFNHLFGVPPELATAMRGFAVERALQDIQIEVRDEACTLVAVLVRGEAAPVLEDLVGSFARCVSGKRLRSGEAVLARHAGVLGLVALLYTAPYDVPSFMPRALMALARCNSDAAPVGTTVRKAFSEFWRTHKESWEEYRERFSEEELEHVNEMISAPSYYA